MVKAFSFPVRIGPLTTMLSKCICTWITWPSHLFSIVVRNESHPDGSLSSVGESGQEHI